MALVIVDDLQWRCVTPRVFWARHIYQFTYQDRLPKNAGVVVAGSDKPGLQKLGTSNIAGAMHEISQRLTVPELTCFR